MINGVGTSQSSTATNNTSTAQAGQGSNILGKDDFLKLMITQMKNQDPMSPMDGSQFASQLAQFSSLEQLSNLNTNMETSINANYMLSQSINNTMSATLIGKDVKLSGTDFAYQGNDNIQLGYNLPSEASDVSIEIYNEQGALVNTIKDLPKDTGPSKLSYDFTDNNGKKLPVGNYSFKVVAKSMNDTDMTVDSYKLGKINGVKFSNSGTSLLVDGVEYSLSDILEILNPD